MPALFPDGLSGRFELLYGNGGVGSRPVLTANGVGSNPVSLEGVRGRPEPLGSGGGGSGGVGNKPLLPPTSCKPPLLSADGVKGRLELPVGGGVGNKLELLDVCGPFRGLSLLLYGLDTGGKGGGPGGL